MTLGPIPALLLRAIPRAYREELAGDLLEEYEELRTQVGQRIARHRLWSRLVWAVLTNLRVRASGWLRHGCHFHGKGPFRSGPRPSHSRRLVLGCISQDIHFAVRILGKRPLFSLVAVSTLGLGIGASTAMFSVVEGVLLRSPPYRDPGRLVKIWP